MTGEEPHGDREPLTEAGRAVLDILDAYYGQTARTDKATPMLLRQIERAVHDRGADPLREAAQAFLAVYDRAESGWFDNCEAAAVHLRAALAQVVRVERLDRGIGADGHEDRRVDRAVGSLEAPGPRAAAPVGRADGPGGPR